MAMSAQILVNNYGLPLDFADQLIRFLDNDLENAIRVLEESEKDVVVLKAKFLSNRKGIYGGLILFYNFRTAQVEYVLAVVARDNNLSRVRLDVDWEEFYHSLTDFSASSSFDPGFSERIEQAIMLPNNQNYISSFFVDFTQIDLVNAKRFLLSEVSKVVQDTGILIKLMTQGTDVFKFRSKISEFKRGIKQVPKEESKRIILLTLSVDPVLSPIGGIDIEKVVPGLQIKVKLNDDREIAYFVGKILGGVDSSGLKEAIYGRLVYKKKIADSENVRVMVEFGPGIYGTFRVGNRVKVDYNRDEKILIPSDEVMSEKEKKALNPKREETISLSDVQLNVNTDPQKELSKIKSSEQTWSLILFSLLGAIALIGLFLILFLFV